MKSITKAIRQRPDLLAALWIMACFTLTSAGYLAWVYHLIDLVGNRRADWLSMVAGYTMQAAGTALAVHGIRRSGKTGRKHILMAAFGLFGVFSVPALQSSFAAGAAVFGLLMNLCCGVIAGFYLRTLAEFAADKHRGTVFGAGYSLSTLLIWMISRLEGGSFLHTRGALPCILLLTAALCVLSPSLLCAHEAEEQPKPPSSAPGKKTLLLAAGTVFLMSLVKNLGFGFPSADLSRGLDLELSRVFYAAGLITAGLISDRERKAGAVCTLAALVIPFIMVAMIGEPVSSFILWSLDYLFFAFFSVYRVVLFTDLACRSRRMELAAIGLLAGRLGDSAGTALCLPLSENRVLLIALTAALFAVCVGMFFRLYQQLYEPEVTRQRTEKEVFDSFAMQHDLSAREQEVLRLLIGGRSNGEIAEILFVSESTVKFHVHNLLKKSGCKSRMELLNKYKAMLYA